MKGERVVGGLRCTEVLEDLSEYLDGTLPAGSVDRINEHLLGCDLCERFGGDMAETVRALRERLGEPEPLEDEVASRLRKRLRADLGRE